MTRRSAGECTIVFVFYGAAASSRTPISPPNMSRRTGGRDAPKRQTRWLLRISAMSEDNRRAAASWPGTIHHHTPSPSLSLSIHCGCFYAKMRILSIVQSVSFAPCCFCVEDMGDIVLYGSDASEKKKDKPGNATDRYDLEDEKWVLKRISHSFDTFEKITGHLQEIHADWRKLGRNLGRKIAQVKN